MAILQVADVVEVKFGTYNAGQAGINVRHYYVSAVGTAPQSDAQAAIYMDLKFAPVYKAWMGSTATYYGVSLQIISDDPKPVPVIQAGLIGPGTGGTGVLPGQVSGMITLRSTLAGRRNRGRVYMPFPPTSANDPVTNQPTDAATLGLQGLSQSFVDDVLVGVGAAATTLTPVIKHSGGFLTVYVASSIARQRWATQRRRGNYGKKNPYPPF